MQPQELRLFLVDRGLQQGVDFARATGSCGRRQHVAIRARGPAHEGIASGPVKGVSLDAGSSTSSRQIAAPAITGPQALRL
jgi:hypothetical protein